MDNVKKTNSLKNFVPRLYQEVIFSTCLNYNTLVVIPTGLGKTFIFLMTAIKRLENYPNSKVLLLGPTKPLVNQYFSVFKEHIDSTIYKMSVFTGKTPPSERSKLWKESRIVFSTPQGLVNDIISSRISLSNVSLIGFDEAHRAVGNYSYVWIAKQYHKTARFFRIVGLTASPGTDIDKIKEVCENLFIEKVEVRSDTDPDVAPYIKPIKIKWIEVELPDELKKIKEYLVKCFNSKISSIKQLGFLKDINSSSLTKTQLLKFQSQIRAMLATDHDPKIFRAISLVAEAMKVEHAIDLVETQDIYVLKQYMNKLVEASENGKVKAVKNLVLDSNFKSAYYLTLLASEKNIKHPKLIKLKELMRSFDFEDTNFKVIIFTQYRDSAMKLFNELKDMDNVNPVIFVGQAKKNDLGLSQKEQKKVLENFKEGKYNVLISTSVGEEGIDIPNVNVVIFYETVPSTIRQIQRRGRTGRQSQGKLYILYTKGTRDEAFRWSVFHKEKKMYSILDKIKKNIILMNNYNSDSNVTSLNEYKKKEDDKKIKIIADTRERSSLVLKILSEFPVIIELKKMDVGDYLLSENHVVEFKNSTDFISSILDGRLFDQAKRLKSNFDNPLFIVQGDISSNMRIHPNAVKGAIISLIIDFKLPVIFTNSAKESAYFLYNIANRVQNSANQNFSSRLFNKPISLEELQFKITSSLPGVGVKLAKPLLEHFHSLQNIANAEIDDFLKINNFGPKRAKNIYYLFRLKYSDVSANSNNTILDDIYESIKNNDF